MKRAGSISLAGTATVILFSTKKRDFPENMLKSINLLNPEIWVVESISELGGLYLEGEEVDGAELEDSVSLALKSYTLEFIAEKEENEPEKTERQTPQQSPAPTLKKEEEENLEGRTKVFFFGESGIFPLCLY